MRNIKIILLLMVLFINFCKKNNKELFIIPFDVFSWENQLIIEGITKEYILPNYANLQKEALNLKNNAQIFKDNPTIKNLKNWQNSLNKVYHFLTLLEPFYFGPANDPRTLFWNMYSWSFGKDPCFQSINCSISVESIINGSSTIDQNYINSLGILVKGITILEYLIFTDGGSSFTENQNDQDILNSLTGRKLEYAVALSENIYSNAYKINEEWNSDFIFYFLNPSLTNPYYKSQLDILSEFNVQIIDQLSRIIDRKIGYPAGLSISSGGNKHLDKIESLYAKQSIVSIYNNLFTIFEIYNGDFNRRGLKHILYRYDEELADLFADEIYQLLLYFKEHKVKNHDIKFLIENDYENLNDIYQRIRNLRIFFSTDFVSSTGTNPGVGSSDGD
ncbi:MAG: hypothetical protein KatS3mg129_2214 [Leptospiraceae bacterium]|nr:MAG: hypothetical protein KatS3mg129_2214 [Leptospiraceae bacterium]